MLTLLWLPSHPIFVFDVTLSPAAQVLRDRLLPCLGDSLFGLALPFSLPLSF